MPANDQEVFERFISDEDADTPINFIAYAIFAHHKREWANLYASRNNGQSPSQQDIDNWISNITDFHLNDMKEEAVRFFDTASRKYLSDEIEAAKQQAVNQSILAEVKQFTSPWRHIGIALLMAVVAPFLLGGIVYFYGLYHGSIPNPFAGH
jgi:hypothetical protein